MNTTNIIPLKELQFGGIGVLKEVSWEDDYWFLISIHRRIKAAVIPYHELVIDIDDVNLLCVPTGKFLQNISKYIILAEQGTFIQITKHNKPSFVIVSAVWYLNQRRGIN